MKEEEQESRGDFHDFDNAQPDDLSFLKIHAQKEKPEPLVYEKSKIECLLEQILKELIQIRKKLK